VDLVLVGWIAAVGLDTRLRIFIVIKAKNPRNRFRHIVKHIAEPGLDSSKQTIHRDLMTTMKGMQGERSAYLKRIGKQSLCLHYPKSIVGLAKFAVNI
jgi:hypothetical protein